MEEIYSRRTVQSCEAGWSLFLIGGKKEIFRMKVQRYKCKNKDCDYVRQETIPIVTDSCSLSIVLPGTWFGYWKRWFLEVRKMERSWYQASCYWPLCSVWILRWKMFYLWLYALHDCRNTQNVGRTRLRTLKVLTSTKRIKPNVSQLWFCPSSPMLEAGVAVVC